MSLSSFFSSFIGVAHADAPEAKQEPQQEGEKQKVEEAEAEEEEPEDVRVAFLFPSLSRA